MKQSDLCKIYNKLCNNSRSDNRFLTGAVFVLCDSKNKPPAMQGEGRSLDISNLLC